MTESLSDRIRKRIEEARKDHPDEYMGLLPKKDLKEPDPDTDKQYFSPVRLDYETSLDSIDAGIATASEYHNTQDLDETLDALNRTMTRLSHPVHRKGFGSLLKGFIRKFVLAGIRPEYDDIQQTLSMMTRTINSLNHKARVFAGKQESFNSDVAVFGQKLVPVIDEKIRYSIERHSRYLKDRMDVIHEGIDRRQTEIANWLHNATTAFEDCINRVNDMENELRRGLALQHRKLEQILRQEKPQQESSQSPDKDPAGSTEAAGGSYAYYLFETQGRGSESFIREKQAEYLSFFKDNVPVLDIGCGRGEFLELLKNDHIPSRGIDSNPDMVEICKNKGLEVVCSETLQYLKACDPNTLGGIFAGQVIEHLPARLIHQWLQEAFKSLKPGGVLILETINAASPYALLNHYYKDPTHHPPIHPETYKFFVEIAGFDKVTLTYRSPVPMIDRPRLPDLPDNPGTDTIFETIRDVSVALEHLFDFIYAPCDIVIYARKPEAGP
ncbi:class I SAM-dependent methyltransferase [bacterium]|nr:class I SAM-dependent methyltransferase [candidate division CSSED10-310 bacterium]